jgi:hypothetical protein
MALTITNVNGAVATGATQVTLAAFTNPSTGPIGPKTWLKFATGEICLVTDATLSPTLSVVRGYFGTDAVPHNTLEGVSYGLSNDTAWSGEAVRNIPPSDVMTENAAEMTMTGTTGSNAAPVTVPAPAFLDVTGTTGGINLPVPTVGMRYWVKNAAAAALNVYCVGGSINGTTGTTAVSISNTGNKGESFRCATAGAWQVVPVAT